MRSRRNWGSHGYVTAIGMFSHRVRQQVMAYMRDWHGSHQITSYEPSSSGLPPTIHVKFQETHMLWYSAVWWQAYEVKWSEVTVLLPNRITSSFQGCKCVRTSVFSLWTTMLTILLSVVKLFLKFVQICSNKFIEESWEGGRQKSKDLKVEDTVEIIVNEEFHKHKQEG